MSSKPNRMAWKVDGTHVYPVNDLREHSITDCWCSPIDDDGIVVHNSLDGREMRPVSAEGSQAGMKRGSYNDRAAKIAVIASKPAVFKAEL